MSEQIYKCKKCRSILFTHSNISIFSDMNERCNMSTQIFVEETRAPPWILHCIENGLFLKGKLNCPKCKGRVGAFDFVSHIPCQCGNHVVPPIRFLCDRIDDCMPADHNLPETVCRIFPKRPLPNVRKFGNCINTTGETFVNDQSHVNATSSTDASHIGNNWTTWDTEARELGNTTEEELVNNERITFNNDEENLCSDSHEENNAGNSGVQEEHNTNECDSLNHVLTEEDEQKTQESEFKSSVDQDILTCAVCLELFYLPQTCEPCKHIFCDPCVRQLKANTLYDMEVKCPLCRMVINSCSLNTEFSEKVKCFFPEEYLTRRSIEKKSKNKHLPSLPGVSVNSVLRRRRVARNGNSPELTVLAGVCFVIMVTMLGFTVFAVTVGFVSWYLLEVAMDLVVDLTAELSTFFELLRSVIIIFCIDGNVKEEYMQSLFNSTTRILMAFAKVIDNKEHTTDPGDDETLVFNKVNRIKENMSDRTNELLTKVTQATIANYVVVGGLVTYMLYRLAKYLQTARAARIQR